MTESDIYQRLFSRSKLPMVFQAEGAECALACLSMILRFYQHHESIGELRRHFPISERGINLDGLMSLAFSLDLSCRALRLELNDLNRLQTPCILHWEGDHFVVLKKVGRSSCVIHDPAAGIKKLSFSEISNHFTGIALELKPAPGFQKQVRAERVYISDLWTKVSGLTPNIIQIALLSLVVLAFSLMMPLVYQVVIDDVITKADHQLLFVVVCAYILVVSVQSVTELFRSWVSLVFAQLLSFQMRSNLLKHVLSLTVPWFEKRHIGDIVSRLNSIEPIQQLFVSGGITLILDGVIALAAIAIMYFYNSKLASIVLGFFVIGVFARLVFFPYLRRLTESDIQKKAELDTVLLETVRGARSIKIFGKEDNRHRFWQNEFAESLNRNIQLQKYGIGSRFAGSLWSGLGDITVLGLAALEVISASLTLGMFFAFQGFRGQFSSRAKGFIDQLFTLKMIGLHLERLSDVVHADPEESNTARLLENPDQKIDVALENVSFSYSPTDNPVFSNANLEIPHGKHVVIIGPSGGGKTTLIKLVLGLYQPDEGRVLVNGTPLHERNMAHTRSTFGVVMQDDRLFSGTLAENISFFDVDPDYQKIEEAARIACIHHEVQAMPMQYQSRVGDLGSSLSGGQQQRIMIARALYREPVLLLMDEGTANLDSDTELKILKNIGSLGITQISVTHRSATLTFADLTYRISDGTISSPQASS